MIILLIPFEYKYTDNELTELVVKKFNDKDSKINCVIQIDKDYVDNIKTS